MRLTKAKLGDGFEGIEGVFIEDDSKGHLLRLFKYICFKLKLKAF